MFVLYIFSASNVNPTLLTSATHRLSGAFSQATLKSYMSMFRLFIALAIFYNWDFDQVNTLHVLSFLEFFHVNDISFTQMKNYISAIKTMLIMYNHDVAFFQDRRISLFIRSCQINAPLKVKMKSVFDIPMLTALCKACSDSVIGQTYKTAYLLGFFGFLRLANLVPHSRADFSIIRHLTRGDIFFSENHAVVLIKWSKTIRSKDTVRLIRVPKLNSVICPFSALKIMLAKTPGHKNSPLFQIFTNSSWYPMLDSHVRCHLKRALIKATLSPTLTFHALRRSGATFSFNTNVSIQNIQKHGTWTSDCVWRYITDSHQGGSQVADNFRRHLAVTTPWLGFGVF